ncbi:MAG: hypothetical protein QXF28_06235 [Nitrososphaerota archaeon]
MKITFKTPTGKSAHLEVSRLNPFILTGGSSGRIRKVAEFLERPEVFIGERGHVIVNGLYNGLKISAISTGMGPSSIMIVLPEVIEAVEDDFTVILRLGTAGSLQPYVRRGHIHIPTSCVRDEGATTAVIGSEYPATASIELIPLLLRACERNGYVLGENLWVGPVHTKDDLYFRERPNFSPRRAELREKLNSFVEIGVISSEMEFSAYCILRDYYERYLDKRIFVGCVLMIVSDFYEEGLIDTCGVESSKVDYELIKIGLETFTLFNSVKNGESIDMGDIYRELFSLHPRSRYYSKKKDL